MFTWHARTAATCAPGRDDSGVLWWLYGCLRDSTPNYHAGASSLRLLYRSEIFTPVRNLATVSCKREMTTRFDEIGLRVDWNEWLLWITRVLYQREVYFPIRRFEMTPSLCKQKVIQVSKWRRCEFCHVNIPLVRFGNKKNGVTTGN